MNRLRLQRLSHGEQTTGDKLEHRLRLQSLIDYARCGAVIASNPTPPTSMAAGVSATAPAAAAAAAGFIE